ncbi:MAG: HAD family phosphatase [Acidobacteria bacterium]|nr:HAD family phosphatase [Acidobacteriota bacterium]
MPFDSILFDFDGVIADSEGLHYQCWTEILTPLGIPLDWDTYCATCIGITDRDMLEVLCRQTDPPYSLDDLWQHYPRKKQIFRDRALANPPIPAETRAVLLELGHMPLAVVSSSNHTEVEPVLERAGIRQCFREIVTGDRVTNRKPHPEPYLLAARLLGVERPLVVEDSDAGVASGQAAGFPVLRIHDPYALSRSLLGVLEGSKQILI